MRRNQVKIIDLWVPVRKASPTAKQNMAANRTGGLAARPNRRKLVI